MTFDATINLGTVIQGVVLLLGVGAMWGSLRRELTDIKERLGYTEKDVKSTGDKTHSVVTRLATLENDMEWVKRSIVSPPKEDR